VPAGFPCPYLRAQVELSEERDGILPNNIRICFRSIEIGLPQRLLTQIASVAVFGS
jgi:hypothetical protein